MKFNIGAVFLAALVIAPLSSHAQDDAQNWTGHVFAGYTATNGNTKKGAGNLAAEGLRKMDSGELLLKANVNYSESNGSMDGQKWDALAKYSLDFGSEKQYYNFYQIYVDHDYFADIDYRLTPSAGLGYHIANTEDWKWDVDAGLGYRISKSRSTGLSTDTATAVLHTYMKKKVFDKSFISEDLTVYPGLKSDSGVLTRSETAFVNPISDKLDFEVKYILDHNSKPAGGNKKTDTQFITGLRYKF
jgi:putative salt-induced outer membrane protein YdiY